MSGEDFFKLNNKQIDYSTFKMKIDENSVADENVRKLFNIFDVQKEDGKAGKDGILSGNEVKNLWDKVREYATKNQNDTNVDKDDTLDKEEAAMLLESTFSNEIGSLKQNGLSIETLFNALNIIKDKIINTDNKSNNDNTVKKLTGNVEITREDGIKFQIKDKYEGEIDNDDNGKFINTQYGDQTYCTTTITITDNNGLEHKFQSLLTEANNILDLRRQELAIANFFNRIPSEEIKELIDNNVRAISFESIPDEDFPDMYNLDKNGEDIIINEDEATIVSPSFAAPKRNYNTEVKSLREDNYEISIKDIDENSSELTIKSPNGENHIISISLSDTCDTDTFHQILRPQLIEILNNFSSDILNDFISEINEIRLTQNCSNAGIYPKGSNTLSINYDSDYNSNVSSNPEITFIHELGHALDNIKNIYSSQDPSFTDKYNEFSKLAQKYEYEYLDVDITFEEYQYGKKYEDWIVSYRNHALDNEKEFFASAYADANYTGESDEHNHIKELDKIILSFKDSDNPDKQRCYQLYQELKMDVNNIVKNTRNKPSQNRKDDSLKNFVHENGKEAFNTLQLLADEGVINFVADSPELTLINYLSRNEDEITGIIKGWEYLSNHPDLSDEIKNNLSKLITQIKELRLEFLKI